MLKIINLTRFEINLAGIIVVFQPGIIELKKSELIERTRI
jgi:hypothetical protein